MQTFSYVLSQHSAKHDHVVASYHTLSLGK